MTFHSLVQFPDRHLQHLEVWPLLRILRPASTHHRVDLILANLLLDRRPEEAAAAAVDRIAAVKGRRGNGRRRGRRGRDRRRRAVVGGGGGRGRGDGGGLGGGGEAGCVSGGE